MLTNRFQTNVHDFNYLNGIDETPPHAPAAPMSPPPETPPPASDDTPAAPQSSQRNHNFSKGFSEARHVAEGGGLMSTIAGAAKSAWGDIKGAAQEGAPEIDQVAEDVAPEIASGEGADAGLLILAA